MLLLFVTIPAVFGGNPKTGTFGLGFANDKALDSTNSRVHINVCFPVIVVTTNLGAKLFVTEQFSLSVGHGLQFFQLSGSDDWGITALHARSFENVGFHFYFNN